MQRMGWGNAMYQLFLCEEFSAQRALELGLVQEATKGAALTYLQQGEAAAIAAIPEIRRQVFASADFKESIQSFMERREARFQGR
jgi:enoyl-CoA hydratase/carnithine racemase